MSPSRLLRHRRETISDLSGPAAAFYLGHFKHAQTYTCIQALWRDFTFLRHFFLLSSEKVTPIDQSLRREKSLRRQVCWVERTFPEHVRLIQVGCYYEAFGDDATLLASRLGLELMKNWRGYSVGCGFPQKHLLRKLGLLKRQRVPVVVVRQTGREVLKAKERALYLIMEYRESE